MRDMRIVITCVTFEVAKVVKPILFYRADKVYILHWGGKAPYTEFIKEVEGRIKDERIELVKKEVMILDFASVLREIRTILTEENDLGNHVYVNIGAGPQVFSSAAMVACMMEGGTPFNAPTKEFTVDSKEFFENGRPVGIAKDVYDPKEIPVFSVSPPDPSLIKGLKVWKEVSMRYRSRQTKEVMIEMENAGLMTDIYEDERRKKVSQGALMRYRRNYLEKWESNRWIRKDKRGRYLLTDQGLMMLDIFG